MSEIIKRAENILEEIRGKEFLKNNPFESEEEAEIFIEGFECMIISSDVFLGKYDNEED